MIRMRRHLRQRRMNRLTDISLTPLIDTALTLLVIFMIATPMVHNSIRVTLPHGQVKEDNSSSMQELVVYIDKDGICYFNNNKVDFAQLIAKIKEEVGSEDEKTVYVKADQSVSYGTVLELVDEIKVVSGVKYVALSTQKRQKSSVAVG